MAAKKKTRREQLATLDSIFSRFKSPSNESYVDAQSRGNGFPAALTAAGLGVNLAAQTEWTRFTKAHGGPISLDKKPSTKAALDNVEMVVGHSLPPSYRKFMSTWGQAHFYRHNPAESATILTVAQSLKLYKRLKKPWAISFADNPQSMHGKTPWPLHEQRSLFAKDAARIKFWPICPYYQGAFGIALGLFKAKESPILCWNPDYEVDVVSCYGNSMAEWFSQMVDWSIKEIEQLAALEFH
jgi:hypothetical protein